MITFTIPSFISYSLFVSAFSIVTFKTLCYIIDDIKSNKKQTEKKVKSSLKIGGIYGKRRFVGAPNNPFSPIGEFAYYVAILDIKPSRDGECEYCQYVHLNDKMSPYSSYCDTTIFSNPANYFDDWEYIKDIDLNTIKFS